ncbi:MAG: hypothetical protein ACN6ON_14115 [Sphingobacterium sp.]
MTARFIRLKPILLLVIALVGISSCSKSVDPPPVEKSISLSGTAEKGPFTKGASLTIQELDNQLKPTGRTFTTKTIDDKGSFEFQNIALKSDFIQVNIDGNYFDEITGHQSTTPIKLSSLVNIRDKKQFNLNILGQLEQKRVQYLVQSQKLDFTTAKTQAIAEVYKALFVGSAAPSTSESISLSDGSDHAAILLAVSAALLKASESDNIKLAALVQTIANDLETDGKLSETVGTIFKNSLSHLNTDLLIFNIKKHYKDNGLELKNFNIQDQFAVRIVGEIIKDSFFKTLEDFQAFNNSIRLDMVRLSEQYFILEGLYTRTIVTTTSENYTQFYRGNVSASNPLNSDLFDSYYRLIRKINLLVDQSRKTKVMDAQQFQYTGYTYLALLYDQMINLWGDPIFVHPDNYKELESGPAIARSKTKDVRTELINGLKTAVPKLTSADYGLGVTVLARLLRDQELYTEARVQLDRLMQSGLYSLAAPFKVHSSGVPEGILSWDFGAVGSIARNDNAAWYSKGRIHHIVRYSEVLLISSEVDYHLGRFEESLQQFNQIRKRNGLEIRLTSPEAIWLAIVDVYGEDMENEGLYFAALKRVHRAGLKLSIGKNKLLLPIPERQLLQNPLLTQNPGY